jgi:hypothetical protein
MKYVLFIKQERLLQHYSQQRPEDRLDDWDRIWGPFDPTGWLYGDAAPAAWQFPVVDGQPSASHSTAVPEPRSEEPYNYRSGGIVPDPATFHSTDQQLPEESQPQPSESDSRDGGHILQQRAYRPPKSLEEFVPETIITFSTTDGGGISITDALAGNFEKLERRDDWMFEDRGTSVSIRLEVCRLPVVHR